VPRALKALQNKSANGQITQQSAMKLETRVFDLFPRRYSSLAELAKNMGISVSQIYRVKQGKRPISEKFITGTVKAFPGYKLDDLFCVVTNSRRHDRRY